MTIPTRNLIGWITWVAAGLVLGGQIASAHTTLAERIAVLSAQVARDPKNTDLLITRAEVHREARQFSEALDDLDRAGRIDRSLASPDLVRARVHLDRRDWQASVDSATRFLARHPTHANARIVRARALAHLGRRHASADDFSAALAERPLPDIYIERAHVVAGDGDGGLAEALRGLDEGIDRLGPIVTLELEAIDIELGLRRYDAALARVDRVAAQTHRTDSWLARRGAVLERAGRLDEARAAYQAALDSAVAQPARIQHTRASMTLVTGLRADIARLATHGDADTPRRKVSR